MMRMSSDYIVKRPLVLTTCGFNLQYYFVCNNRIIWLRVVSDGNDQLTHTLIQPTSIGKNLIETAQKKMGVLVSNWLQALSTAGA